MRRDASALDAYLRALYERMDLPGIAVAAWGPDGEGFAAGYGRADGEGLRPVDPDTVFGIASMSKSQTALCCAILEAEGKLSLDDPVYRYFPGFRVPGAARDAVTLRHLARHTAGIPPIEPLEWSIVMNSPGRDSEWATAVRESAPGKFDTMDEIIAYIADCPYPALGAPGEVMSYCNEGYALLSAVVDQAAGMPLERFLQERIYGPLGMTRTVLDVDASEARTMAGGNITSLFEKVGDALVCDDSWSVLPPYRGCGLVKSTARDMAAYYRCLSDGGMHEGRQAVPRAAVERLAGAEFATRREPVYALGLYKRAYGGHVICEHAGGLHGVSSFGGFLMDGGWGFAALCNQGDVDVNRFVWAMYNWAMGTPLAQTHRWQTPAGRDFSDPEMVVGTYRSHEGVPTDVTVYFDGRGALCARKEALNSPLVYCGGTHFCAFDEEGEIALRLKAYIRDGQAWGMLCGSRVYQRLDEDEMLI